MATETARTIIFGIRRVSFQQLDAQATTGLSLGTPIVLDTPQELELKVNVSLEQIRGGSYLYPLSIEPKEIMAEITGKLTDCPPALAALMTASTYAKNSTPGPAVDAVVQIVGSSIGNRLTGSITGGQNPGNGTYAIQATGANTYVVYDLQTGVTSAPVTTSASVPTVTTGIIPGVTLTMAAGTFTIGDTANIEIINIGSSGQGSADSAMETMSGSSVPGLVLPHVRIEGDAITDGVLYQFQMAKAKCQGTAYPLGQGKFAVPSFGAIPRIPAGGGIPFRMRRIP